MYHWKNWHCLTYLIACHRGGISFSFSCSSRWHRSAWKGPYALRPVSQQSPQGCHRNSANICLVEHRSFSTLEGGMSAASFLHSSFLQAIGAVMLWPVYVQKVPQASDHPCPAKLRTRCDICCACQSICHSFPLTPACPAHLHCHKRVKGSQNPRTAIPQSTGNPGSTLSMVPTLSPFMNVCGCYASTAVYIKL